MSGSCHVMSSTHYSLLLKSIHVLVIIVIVIYLCILIIFFMNLKSFAVLKEL